MSLPEDDAGRKALPIWDGVVMYFPDALAAIAQVSKYGNDQHNPGEPLHWARGKSMDQMNTAFRHMLDHGVGNRYDDGGKTRHLAKAAWRILAALQLDIEGETPCPEATTSPTKKPTKSNPQSSKSERSETKPVPPSSVAAEFIKAMESTSITETLSSQAARIRPRTGGSVVAMRTGRKGT